MGLPGSAVRRSALLAAALAAIAASDPARADPPTFTSQPSDVLIEANRAAGVAVQFAIPGATDDHGAPPVGCDHSPGEVFAPGITLVTCSAEDPQTGEGTTTTFELRVLAPPQEQVQAGGVSALLYYTRSQTSYGLPQYKNIRLVILRNGQLAYEAPVMHYPGRYATVWPAGAANRRSMTVRDLDRDGEPELLLDLYWGGAHCCTWTDVYRYDKARGTYTFASHLWGDLGYRLSDITRSGRSIEFISGDDRFAYAFTSFADSLFPIQIWRYRAGHFTDVTTRFPARIRSDAARQWRYYTHYQHSGRSIRGALAAWVADECLLNRCGSGYARVAALGSAALTGADDFDSASRYMHDLRSFLRRAGYWR